MVITKEQKETHMNWNTNDGLVSKEDAKKNIIAMAEEDGIKGAFKVFYDGELMSTPDSLPANVDMNKVKVSAVLDQA